MNKSLPWFRLWAEFATDHKVQMLSEVDQRRFIMVLCIRCSNAIGNDIEMAFQLRISDQEWTKTKDNLLSRGLITEDNHPTAWDERQFATDSSKERVQKYREKRRAIGLTADGYRKHSVTVTERDGNKCVYCGSSDNLCIDHVLPIAKGGDDSIQNLVCACKACNSGKAGRTPDEAKYLFINKDAEKMWRKWLTSRSVTVTVTAPDTETDTEKHISTHRLRGTRFALEQLPEDWKTFCLAERKDLNPQKCFDAFADYWSSLAGQKAVKLDWFKTWKNWVRNQRKELAAAKPTINEMPWI